MATVLALQTLPWPRGEAVLTLLAAAVLAAAVHVTAGLAVLGLGLACALLLWPRHVRVRGVPANGLWLERRAVWGRWSGQWFACQCVRDVVLVECVDGMGVSVVLALLVRDSPHPVPLLYHQPLAHLSQLRARLRIALLGDE